ncbi:hypothetical protein CI109_102728 [Kwoniella shandongensis]|uniref:KN homeodomain domain-containing protein n=1 Tax=Kwoniella shandongensis TaxID=1734106 RepID=A0A5M6BV50_9TREE|nr:uncharacterized protein CI109_004949 [Kwoniella shandongensis]KAA5526746.1 hypothetical protein CI109_004949 [Kwoniella shandongensis]
MPSITDKPLAELLLEFRESFFEAIASGQNMSALVEQWEAIERLVVFHKQSNRLDQTTAMLAFSVASRVHTIALATIRLQKMYASGLDELTHGVQAILLSDDHHTSPQRADSHVYSSPSNHETGTEEISSQIPGTLDSQTVFLIDNKIPPLRQWFLDHFTSPYPNKAERDRLALETGMETKNVMTNLTNFRGRSGWSDLLKNHCGNDKSKLPLLMKRIENGQEKRKNVLDDVQRVREWLSRKEGGEVRQFIKDLVVQYGACPRTPSSSSSRSTVSSVGRVSNIVGGDTSRSVSMSSVDTNFSSSSNDTLCSSMTEYSTDGDEYIPPTNNKKRLPHTASHAPSKRLRNQNSQAITSRSASNDNEWTTDSEADSDDEPDLEEGARPIWSFDDVWSSPLSSFSAAAQEGYLPFDEEVGSSSQSVSPAPVSSTTPRKVKPRSAFTKVSPKARATGVGHRRR